MAVTGKRSSRLVSFPGSYDHAFERALNTVQYFERALEQERIEAPVLAERLAALDPAKQQILLDNSGRFQTWGLLQLLFRTGREEIFTDPCRAEEILRTAFEISMRLPSTGSVPGVVDDMRARIWGYIANARRAQMEPEASEDAFKEAFAYLERGTGDPMEKAVLWNLQACLLRIQQRSEESLQLLRRTRKVFQRYGETHWIGRSLVNSSVTYRLRGEIGTAIEYLYPALDLIDSGREPRLALIAWHNLADDLSTAGRFLEARQVLRRAHRLYQQFPHSSIQTRRRWVEAKVAFGLGQPDAETLLEEAHQGFISSNKLYDVDLILQDLASLRAICGRP